MPSRVSAFVIWALVAASALYWALQLAVRGPTAPPYTLPVSAAAPLRGDLTRLFGSVAAPAAQAAVAPELSSRFKLVGVVAPAASAPQGGGIALVSVDGKPPRPYRVGARVEGDLMLRAVARRSAEFGTADGGTPFTLELPAQPPPSTGTLPPPPALGGPPQPESEEPAPPAAPPPQPTVQPGLAAPATVPAPRPITPG
ncbi:MAG TPA: type II secretion system protein N, partial [Ideonella sp.]|nr:type II secretion system protein N [Ideonella sp.]